MRPGKIASVRVNPKDCMSIVDVLSKLGIATTNMSFSQATKIVLASALESFRQSKVIPDRDGFEYTEMMLPFAEDDLRTRGRKLQMAHDGSQPTFHAPPVTTPQVDTPERSQRKVRFDELMFRRTADPTNFTDADLVELAPLLEEFQQ